MAYSNVLKYKDLSGEVGYLESQSVSSVDTNGSNVLISTKEGKQLSITLPSSGEASVEMLNVISNVVTCSKTQSGDFSLSAYNVTEI